METENTPENRSAFFAQYWGQEVMRFFDWKDDFPSERVRPDFARFESVGDRWVLSLKPLSQITDEDVMAMGHVWCNQKEFFHYYGIDAGQSIGWLINEIAREDFDVLRSKGYLLPWRDLSVEEIISYGWAKYENQ